MTDNKINPRIEMNELRQIVEEAYLVNMMTNRRNRETVDARIIFSKILRERGYTFKAISTYLYKHHSTVIHYLDQAADLMKTNSAIMDMYVYCKNKFLQNREPVVILTDRDLVKEVLSLREQVNELMGKYESVRSVEKKYDRLHDIINLIDVRTKPGTENRIKKKINELFNGDY
jgi:hypothetical protein